MLKHRGVFLRPFGSKRSEIERPRGKGQTAPTSEGGWSELYASGGIIYAIYRAYSERGMHQLWLLYRHQLYTHNTIYQY